jgi:MFS family permease
VPKITDELHGLEQVSWYGAVYFLTLGAFRPFWGKVCTYYPMKPTFILTVVIFELGSLICSLAPNPTAFIIGRAITGAGGAGIATGGTTIVALSASPGKRPLYMAFLGTAAALGNITGPLLGGVFSDKITWRWCFYINLPCGAVVVGFILIFLRHESGAKAVNASWKQVIMHMDVAGIILTLSGMVCFILALQYGGVAHPWKNSQVIGLLVGFVLIVGTLIVWELYQKEYAMLQWRLIKKRAIWTTCMFQFFFAGAYFVILYYLPIYFQSIRGASPLQSGVDNLPLVITFGAAMLAGGFAVAATGYATPFMAAGAILTCVSAGLFFSMRMETSSAKWIGYQVLAGAAIAFPYMNCLSLAQAHVDDADISIVSSINQCKCFPHRSCTQETR